MQAIFSEFSENWKILKRQENQDFLKVYNFKSSHIGLTSDEKDGINFNQKEYIFCD